MKSALIEIKLLERCLGYIKSVRSNDITDEPIFSDIDQLEAIIKETQSVTNEGASTATLEELEKQVVEKWGIELGFSHSITSLFWNWLKPHLSALLKEKDEKIDGYKALVQKYLDETTSNPIKDKLLQQQKQIQELQSQLKEKEAEIERLNKALDQSCTDLNQWDGFQPSSTV